MPLKTDKISSVPSAVSRGAKKRLAMGSDAHTPNRKISSARCLALAIAATALHSAVSTPAQAANVTYVGPTGLWSTPGNWNAGAIPTAADNVQLLLTSGASKTVTFNSTSAATTVKSLITDSLVVGNEIVFRQDNNTFTTTIEKVGILGTGIANYFGGTHTVSGGGSNAL